MRIASSLFLVLAFAAPARAQERTVAKLQVAGGPGEADKPIEVWVTRAKDSEGGITVKLIAKGVGPKPQALTLYSGGGADDGAGDAEVKQITARPFELPGGKPGVRVDYSFRLPDGKKKDEQIDTILVGFGGGKTHKVFELRTRLSRDRSKLCREGEEVALSLDGKGLVAATTRTAEPVLGDDDLPLDKTCRAPKGAVKKSYPWKGDRFIDLEAEAEELEKEAAKPGGNGKPAPESDD
jgi:hypothetical protein